MKRVVSVEELEGGWMPGQGRTEGGGLWRRTWKPSQARKSRMVVRRRKGSSSVRRGIRAGAGGSDGRAAWSKKNRNAAPLRSPGYTRKCTASRKGGASRRYCVCDCPRGYGRGRGRRHGTWTRMISFCVEVATLFSVRGPEVELPSFFVKSMRSHGGSDGAEVSLSKAQGQWTCVLAVAVQECE